MVFRFLSCSRASISDRWKSGASAPRHGRPPAVALATVVEASASLSGAWEKGRDQGRSPRSGRRMVVPQGRDVSLGWALGREAPARVAGVRTAPEASRLGHNISDADLFWAGTVQVNYSKTISRALIRALTLRARPGAFRSCAMPASVKTKAPGRGPAIRS